MAFWTRAQAVEHGFESVRTTIEQNFDQLSAVLGAYGLEMDREAAHRKAVRARAAKGWSGEEVDPERTAQALRLVGSEGA